MKKNNHFITYGLIGSAFIFDLLARYIFQIPIFFCTTSLLCLYAASTQYSPQTLLCITLVSIQSFIWYGHFGLELPITLILPLLGTNLSNHLYDQWATPLILFLIHQVGIILIQLVLLKLPIIIPYTFSSICANMILIVFLLKYIGVGRQGNRV